MHHQADTGILSIPERKLSIQAAGVFICIMCTALGAQLEIPTQPVPFTLQTFFVLLSGALLGKRGGAVSMGLYVLMGALGLPVFSGGAGSIVILAGPTGGYLLAFPLAAWVIGYLISFRHEYWWILVSMSIGSLVIFSFGTIQLNLVLVHDWMNALRAGFFIFSWWDGLKIIASTAIAYSYFRRIHHRVDA